VRLLTTIAADDRAGGLDEKIRRTVGCCESDPAIMMPGGISKSRAGRGAGRRGTQGPRGAGTTSLQVALVRRYDANQTAGFYRRTVRLNADFDSANARVAIEGDNTATKLRPSAAPIPARSTLARTPEGVLFDGTNIWTAVVGPITSLSCTLGHLLQDGI
jgi:hypothetical protein